MVDISVRDLNYFLAVADTGNLAAAAFACHVTQPAISKAIRRVEDAVELTLFTRSKSGMALTASGEMFREHALRIRSEHEDAMRHAQDLQSGAAGLLRIGATRPIYDSVVAPAVATLMGASPGVSVRLELDAADVLIDQLLQGVLDLLVVPLRMPVRSDLLATDLCADEVLVLAADDHPARAIDKLALADLVDCRWVLPKRRARTTDWFNDRFHAEGLVAPTPVMEVDHAGNATLNIIANTDLLLFSPVDIAQQQLPPGVSRLPVRALDTTRRLLIVQRRDAYRSAVMSRMQALLVEQQAGR